MRDHKPFHTEMVYGKRIADPWFCLSGWEMLEKRYSPKNWAVLGKTSDTRKRLLKQFVHFSENVQYTLDLMITHCPNHIPVAVLVTRGQ